VSVLLSVIHFLLKGLCFLLINKTKSSKAVFELESVKENSILIIREGVVDLLVPDNTAVGRRNIYELDPECIPHQVVSKDRRSLQSRVGPSVPIWVSNVQLRDCNCMDLVVGLGYRPLDCLLVLIGEDGRHGCESGAERAEVETGL
jgi:hypothetical protein